MAVNSLGAAPVHPAGSKKVGYKLKSEMQVTFLT